MEDNPTKRSASDPDRFPDASDRHHVPLGYKQDKMETIIREAQEANMLHGELGRTLLRNYEIHKGINWQQRAANAGIVMVVLEVTGFVLNLPASVLLVPLIGGVLFAVVFVGLSFTHTFRAIGIQLRPPPPDPVSSAAPPDDIRHADEDSQDPQAPTGPNNEAS